MKYVLLDAANTFARARYVASRTSPEERAAMAIHLTLTSINYAFKLFNADHLVVALEGRSWRKDFYPKYKAHRKLDESAMTETEIEENKLFWQTYEDFTTFLAEKTNSSVIRCPTAEADDVIARFIALHPDDEHFIISTDTDFVQLLSENVKQYNGVTNNLITLDGYFDDRGRPVLDKKTKEPKLLEDPQYLLFKKIIRGDPTDNIFSAYPGVREKGTKTSVGIKEAFEDKGKQGFKWNNFMLQRWTDHAEVEHKVKDMYERNRTLIDLSAMPDEVREVVDNDIKEQLRTEQVNLVGVKLMKFCAKYELNKISDHVETYSGWLNKTYKGNLI
jgi:5'-3' exonuclease